MEFDQLKIHQQDILNKVYSQGIQQNEEHINSWMQYRDRHKKIIDGLKVLSQELSMNCIVPIGKRALMKGKLKHTSEILVCIGDGYFVKYTTQQAIALCHRRIKHSEEMLTKFEQEKKLLETQLMLPLNCGAFESGDCENVIEHWDEKKLEDWKVEHRKKEKEYRKKLKKLKCLKKQEIVTEDDLFRRLDELELEEELADELNRLEEEQNNFYDQVEHENNTDEELDKESEEESDKESEEEESNVKVSDKESEKESNEKENELYLEQISEDKKDVLFNDENLKYLFTPEVQINQQLTTSSEPVNIEHINETIQTRTESTESSFNKDTKINGKFEVSIIKEDEVEKMLGKPILSVESSSIGESAVFEKHKVKKSPRILYNDTNCLESDTCSEKSKGSGRRVSFAEPHFIDVESTSQYEINEKSNKEDFTKENDNDDIIKIDFTHSKIKSSIYENTDNNITNPGDIYRIFCRPKSILKKSPDIEHINKNISLFDNSLEEHNTESDSITKSTYNIVVQDVQEKNVENTISECNELISKNRPISRFKLERSNIKKIFK